MPKVRFTEALRGEYQQLFDACQIRPARAPEVERVVLRLLANKARYAAVGEPLGIPWQLIGVIHSMECSQNFAQHLHNGDPLHARTTHVPAGRPARGEPPFTWEESAADALTMVGLARWGDWSVPGMLYCLEGYNGWGYRLHHPEVKSPYLWSASSQYVSGKYVSDGTWSDTAVSAQCGAASLLRRMAEKGELEADFAAQEPMFTYAPRKVTAGGSELQRFLNRFPGIFLKEDGKLGPKSSAACKQIFGWYLKGDPRD
jgi:lysozyme family protein